MACNNNSMHNPLPTTFVMHRAVAGTAASEVSAAPVLRYLARMRMRYRAINCAGAIITRKSYVRT